MNTQDSQSLTDLFRSGSMTEDTLDIRTVQQLFLAQMRMALYGGKSSVPILPTFLKPFGALPEDAAVAVAQLDDRNVAVRLVTFSGGRGTVSEETSFPIPGREYPAPLADILYAVGELIEPLVPQAKAIALCLPFPLDCDGKGDGVIRRFPGTMTVSDYEDMPVLAALGRELADRELPALPMFLVPQPDAALVAAGVAKPGQSRYLGLTWDADLDVGFVAPGSIVLRWPGIRPDLMLFDGGFSSAECVPFGLVDLSKDRDSYAPGRDLLLKMASADYLGEVYRLVMIKAAERKLLSFGCSRDVLSLTTLDLATLAEFLNDPVTGGTLAHFCREPEDREVGLLVANAVLDRAARLMCAALSAALQFIGAGRDPASPVCIGAWGQALQVPALREKLEGYLQTYTRDTLGLHAALCPVDDLAVGAAAAALYQLP